MKKILFIFPPLLFLLLSGSKLQAEPSAEDTWGVSYTSHIAKEKAFVRRAKGMHGLGTFGGVAAMGPIVGLEWNYWFFPSSQFKLLGAYGWIEKTRYITYRSLHLQPMVYQTVYTDYDFFSLNMGLGGTMSLAGKYRGWKPVKRGRQTTTFNAGIILGGEIEAFVFKAIKLTLAGGPIINILKERQDDMVTYYLVAGIKINV